VKRRRRVPAERRAEAINELRLRPIFSNKRMCQRYGFSLSTLKRLQTEAFERPLANVSQISPDAVRALLSNGDDEPQKVKQHEQRLLRRARAKRVQSPQP
jgi:hypothetical protein